MRQSDQETAPLISVIIPTYNGTSFIQEAIFSVLQQRYPNTEILVCDDASQDQTIELVQEFKHEHDVNNQIQIITQKYNQGISRNMNTGLEAANGKYIAVLDQDDFRRDPNKLDKQTDFLEQHREHKIVGTNAVFDIYGYQQTREYPLTDKHIRSMILGCCPMLHSSVMYDRELAIKIGGYSESYKYAMDYKFFLDLMKDGKGANLGDTMTYYRWHGKNASIVHGKTQKLEAENIRKEHKNNFPNWTKSMICYKTISLLNNVFGDNPMYVKLKNDAKKVYLKTQSIL